MLMPSITIWIHLTQYGFSAQVATRRACLAPRGTLLHSRRGPRRFSAVSTPPRTRGARPSPSDCVETLDEAQVPVHIRAHSELVAAIASFVARELRTAGVELDVSLVEVAALLHDIGKQKALDEGGNHAERGAMMLSELGLCDEIVAIVREHASLNPEAACGPLTESLVVNYADKRVRHAEIVSLEARFDDLEARYARGSEKGKDHLRKLCHLYALLEDRIFAHLELRPRDIDEATLRRKMPSLPDRDT